MVQVSSLGNICVLSFDHVKRNRTFLRTGIIVVDLCHPRQYLLYNLVRDKKLMRDHICYSILPNSSLCAI